MDMRVAPAGLEANGANRPLDLLCTDDVFRDLFVKNTKAALEVAGYTHLDARLPHPAGCFWPPSGKLASKEAISAAREKMITTVSSVQAMICPFEG